MKSHYTNDDDESAASILINQEYRGIMLQIDPRALHSDCVLNASSIVLRFDQQICKVCKQVMKINKSGKHLKCNNNTCQFRMTDGTKCGQKSQKIFCGDCSRKVKQRRE